MRRRIFAILEKPEGGGRSNAPPPPSRARVKEKISAGQEWLVKSGYSSHHRFLWSFPILLKLR